MTVLRRAASAAVLVLALVPRAHAVFNLAEMKVIDDAEKNMQVMFHALRPDEKEQVPIPKGLEEYIPAMQRKMAWRDPDEGLLSEARLWQSPASLLYEFFEITRRTFPSDTGGSSTPPNYLVRHYEDNRFRFQMSVDRIYRARLGDSFGGRGRAVLSSLDLILKEMDSLITSLSGGAGTGLSRQQLKEYKQAVLAITQLTETGYGALVHGSRGPEIKEEAPKEAKGFTWLMMLIGVGAIFLSAWLAFRLNEDLVHQKYADYLTQSKAESEQYRKQFINVNVHVIKAVPAAGGVLLGMLAFSIPLMAIFGVIGFIIGSKLPAIILDNMREARGRRCEAQLMDSLVLMSNALKSGQDITQAFDMVAKEMRPPISEEFGLMMRNYGLGTPFDEAMRGLEDRVSSKLLSYMIKAILIQRQVGGNLTKIFDRIVDNIREESKLEQKVGALTAQQKIQSIVVGVAPIIMVSVMFVMQPDTMIKFYSSVIGVVVAIFCATWLSIGMVVTNKLSKVEV